MPIRLCAVLTPQNKSKQANYNPLTLKKINKSLHDETVVWICSSIHIAQLCKVFVFDEKILTCHFLSVIQSICIIRMLKINHKSKDFQ